VDLAEVELDKRLQPKEGEQFTLEGSMKKLIHYELRQLTEDKELQKKLIAEFERKKGLEHTLEIVLMGYNPVLLWSKEGVLEIVPDFLLGHHFASEFNKAGAYVLVPLLSHLSTIMRPFTGYDEFAYKPRTYASPKVLIREGRRLVEYEISLHGHFGFELVRKKGKDIGRIRK
jgi:hypothetical protein